MKLAVGERNVATNIGTTPGCVVEYCFSISNMDLRPTQLLKGVTLNISEIFNDTKHRAVSLR